jgi:hypothetical protein
MRGFERIENHLSDALIEVPQPLRLTLRQMQSWHFGVLALNQANPIMEVFGT